MSIINEKALLEDTVSILVDHNELDETEVRLFFKNNPQYMETMVTEMYSAQEGYIQDTVLRGIKEK